MSAPDDQGFDDDVLQPAREEQGSSGLYTTIAFCTNCRDRLGVTIPKGQMVSATACPVCGNQTLQ